MVYALMSANPTPAIGGAGVIQLPRPGQHPRCVQRERYGVAARHQLRLPRAFATNAGGTSYSAVVLFTTATTPPPAATGPKQAVPTPAQQAPILVKNFNGSTSATVSGVGFTATLSCTVTNPNTTPLTGAGFAGSATLQVGVIKPPKSA